MSKKVAMAGMFTALAMIFSYVEVLIPISLGIPGIKLGLANLVVVVALYTNQNFRLSVSVWPEVFSIMRDSWQLPWRWWKTYTFCHTCHY